MAYYNSLARKRASKAVDAFLVLLVILLVLQVWLLSASVELWLAGHHEVAIPAAAVSGLLFASGVGLIMLIRRTEQRTRDHSSM